MQYDGHVQKEFLSPLPFCILVSDFTLKIQAFLDVTSCWLANPYQHTGGTKFLWNNGNYSTVNL